MNRTADAAKGKWRGILLQLGVHSDFLRDKHGPCPFCGGQDRYRWDNKDGTGSFICSQCGAGNGFDFLKRFRGWDFAAAAKEVDQIVGNVVADRVKRAAKPEDQRARLNRLWKDGLRLQPKDPVSLYLFNRGLDTPENSDCLRYVEECPVPNEVGSRMAMVAMITGIDGKAANLHRTFLTPRGTKADMDAPRATMPGELPEGSAIRLAPHDERLGIAEGIETALAATKRFGLPVWAAVNSTMLAKWIAPAGVKEVVVFGDNDPKFGGAAAAYTLAHRLAVRQGLSVTVQIPGRIGADWADADAV